jgi:hypothetical protein
LLEECGKWSTGCGHGGHFKYFPAKGKGG